MIVLSPQFHKYHQRFRLRLNYSRRLTNWKKPKITLQWRHNEHDSVSNHQPHDCLLNRLFGRKSKKTSKLRVTGLCAGNSPGTGEFPAQRASNAENISLWWRHHGILSFPCNETTQLLRFSLKGDKDVVISYNLYHCLWPTWRRYWPNSPEIFRIHKRIVKTKMWVESNNTKQW